MKNKKRVGKAIKKYLIIMAFLVVLLWALAPLPRLIKSSQDLKKLKQELAQIQKENQDLKKEIDNMKKDKYVELAAREQLDLAKPGEETYIVVKQKPKPASKKEEKKEQQQQNLLSSVIAFLKQLLGYKQ